MGVSEYAFPGFVIWDLEDAAYAAIASSTGFPNPSEGIAAKQPGERVSYAPGAPASTGTYWSHWTVSFPGLYRIRLDLTIIDSSHPEQAFTVRMAASAFGSGTTAANVGDLIASWYGTIDVPGGDSNFGFAPSPAGEGYFLVTQAMIDAAGGHYPIYLVVEDFSDMPASTGYAQPYIGFGASIAHQGLWVSDVVVDHFVGHRCYITAQAGKATSNVTFNVDWDDGTVDHITVAVDGNHDAHLAANHLYTPSDYGHDGDYAEGVPYFVRVTATATDYPDEAATEMNSLLPVPYLSNSFEASPTTGYAPLTVSYFVSGSLSAFIPGDALNYVFSDNAGWSETRSDGEPEHTYTEQGTYHARVTLNSAMGSYYRTGVTVDVDYLPPPPPPGTAGWSIGAPAWKTPSGEIAVIPPDAPLALRGSGTQSAPFILADQRWWTWDNPTTGGPLDHFHVVVREAFYDGSGDRWDPANYTEDPGRPVIDFTVGAGDGSYPDPDGLPYAIPGHEAMGGDNLLSTADSGLGVYSDRILTVTSVGSATSSASMKAVSRALPGVTWTTVATDTFDRPDDAADINPSSDGGTYTVPVGTAGISGNKGYFPVGGGGTDTALAWRDVGRSIQDISIDNSRSSTTGVSHILACWDGVMGHASYDLAFDSSGSFGRISGQFDSESVTFTPWTGGTTRLRMVVYPVDGHTHIDIYQDDVLIHTYVETPAAPISYTGIAFGTNGHAFGSFTDEFDNLIVKTGILG